MKQTLVATSQNLYCIPRFKDCTTKDHCEKLQHPQLLCSSHCIQYECFGDFNACIEKYCSIEFFLNTIVSMRNELKRKRKQWTQIVQKIWQCRLAEWSDVVHPLLNSNCSSRSRHLLSLPGKMIIDRSSPACQQLPVKLPATSLLKVFDREALYWPFHISWGTHYGIGSSRNHIILS